MKKEITKWIRKHATIAGIGAFFVFLGIYGNFVRGIQKDLDEVRYSREINKIEKGHAKDIEELQHKVLEFREENLSLRQDQFKFMGEIVEKDSTKVEVVHENK